MELWQAAVSVAAGVVIVWAVLVAIMVATARRRGAMLPLVSALRVGPDVVRLIGRLLADRELPWRTRALIGLLGLYLLSPIDLVPDFIPVVGYLDDAIVVVLVLRLTIKRAGRPTIERHWPGTREGLEAVLSVVDPRPHT